MYDEYETKSPIKQLPMKYKVIAFLLLAILLVVLWRCQTSVFIGCLVAVFLCALIYLVKTTLTDFQKGLPLTTIIPMTLIKLIIICAVFGSIIHVTKNTIYTSCNIVL